MPWDTSTRRTGLLVPVFALRHDNDLGIGDTLAVRDALQFCHSMGMRTLQLLPINETGDDHSPYNAISSVALDPALLAMTPQHVPCLSQEMIDRAAPRGMLEALRFGSVQYFEVKDLKNRLLSEAFCEFEACHLEVNSELAQDFTAFREQNEDWLAGYTLYRSLLNEYENNALVQRWAPEHRNLESAERWLETCGRREEIERYRIYYAWIQWVAFSQWRGIRALAEQLGIELIGDIPFGVSRYGADVWASPALFDLEWSGGAPPEPFFKDDEFTAKWGQNWGVPLYHWPTHEAENFAWWKRRVARTCEIFHAFRIDHVLGFFRIYSFPWEPDRNAEFLPLSVEEATERCHGRHPGFLPRPDEPEENARLNCEEGARLLRILQESVPGSGIVAEDLGMVPDYVRPQLSQMGIPGFTIPIWTREKTTNEFVAPTELPALSLCTYATHDHDPLAVMYMKLVEVWTGPDGHQGWLEIQRLMRFLNLDDARPPVAFTPELHLTFLQRALETPCFLAVFMITDLLGTTQRFNLPGTATDANWSERLEAPLAKLSVDPRYVWVLNRFREASAASGR